MLRQQARISWLKEEDGNTKFFYQTLQRRRSSNNIKKLIHQGKTLSESKDIKQAFFLHFKTQFSKMNVVKKNSARQLMVHIISNEDNLSLTRAVTEKKVGNALFQSNSKKSPGPDDLNAGALKSL